ncbi:MAG: hypothetical protein NTX03_07685 [Bacteroidetes bacterium]|nr:hypothetical protein [Bacteroidota bacterium]
MYPQEDRDKALWRLEKFLEIREQLKQNPTFQSILERTYPDSRDGFTDEYAREKVSWLEYGPNNKEWVEREEMRWLDDATRCLGEIQQKKLFDAQCLWRAGQLEIPEVRTSKDFSFWENNIMQCPFISEINENDIEMYTQYLQSFNVEFLERFIMPWQDYDGIKISQDSETAIRPFPEWYDFHNGRTGAAMYMNLPDVKGEKERYYIKLWMEENKRKREENPELYVSKVDPRPYLSNQDGNINYFVNTFDTDEMKDLYRKYKGISETSNHVEGLQERIRILSRSSETPAIPTTTTIAETIELQVHKVKVAEIVNTLPPAFEQYKLDKEMGLFHELEKDKYGDWHYNAILRGRELAGESRDFDY